MTWEVRNGQRVRVVELTVLQSWLRQRLKNDPVHQQKMRALRAAQMDAQDQTRRVPNQS